MAPVYYIFLDQDFYWKHEKYFIAPNDVGYVCMDFQMNFLMLIFLKHEKFMYILI